MKWKAERDTDSTFWKLNSTVAFLKIRKKLCKVLFKFSNLTPRASFLFWNLEIARNFHFYFLCYFSMSRKSKNLVKWHRRCISLLRPYYAFLYFLYFVHGCWCFFFDLLIKSSIHNNLLHWKIKHCCDQSNSYSKKGIRNRVFEPYTYFCVESEFRDLSADTLPCKWHFSRLCYSSQFSEYFRVQSIFQKVWAF